jgi:opacity protein-like surface antigen
MNTITVRLLTLCTLLAVPLAAQAQELADYDYENLTFRGVGFDYGYIWPTRVEPTSLYSVRLDLGFLGPAVRLSPSISYWSSEFSVDELERLAERLSNLPPLQEQNVTITAADLGTVEWSDLTLSIDAQAVFTAPLGIITFVGVGGSVHALNGRGDAIADTFVEDLLDSTTAGLAVMAGAEYQPVPRLRLYGEARYTLVSDVRYPGVRLGAALMLPERAAATTSGGGR